MSMLPAAEPPAEAPRSAAARGVFPGVPGSIGLVLLAMVAANVVSLPALVLLAFVQHGATEFGRLASTPEGWLALINGVDIALLSIPCNTLGFGFAIWLGHRKSGRAAAETFPLRAVSPASWVIVAVTYAGAILVTNLVSDLLVRVLPVPPWVEEFFANFLGKGRGAAAFILLALVAPITEELLFRGVILQGLARRHGPVFVCTISALLFGAMHVLPWQIVPAFLLGLLFAWWRLETGSLWPPLVAHFVTNSFAWYHGLTHSVHEAFTAPPQPLWLSAAGALLLAAGLAASRRVFRAGATTPAGPFL